MSSQSPSARQEQPRYFCYSCNAEVPIYMAPDPTCQHCNEQFVQEIDAESDPQSFLNGGHDDAVNDDEGGHRPHAYFRYDSRAGNEDDVLQFLDSFAPRDEDGGGGGGGQGGNNRPSIPAMSAMLQNMVTMMLQQTTEASMGGGPMAAGAAGGGNTTASGTGNEDGTTTTSTENNEQGENQQRRGGHPQPVLFYGGMVDGNFQLRPMPMPTAQPRGGEEGEGGNTTGEGGGQGTGAGDNRMNGISSLLQLLAGLGEGMVGNPNDYVFSQDGFDNIITQLMEQAGGRNAPPPASETVIDSLPKRKLTDEEVAEQVDCAVCKEEFVPTEEAIELPCQHMFHEDCIKPWLKVNGTCPVCRHSVSPEKKDQPENSQASSDGGDNARSSTSNASTSTDQQGNNRSTFQQTMMENMRRMYFPTAAGWTARPASESPHNNNNQASSSDHNGSNNNNNNSNTPQHQPSSDSTHNNDNMDLDLD